MDRLVVPVLSAAAADALAALVSHTSSEVVAVAIDVGQGSALDELHDVAIGAGAGRCHAFELTTRLADGFLWPALRAGAVALPGEPVATALTAPCVAEALVEVAGLEHASAVVPLADDPRDRQRLHAAIRALAPGLGLVLAPGTTAPPVSRNVWAVVEAVGAGDVPPARPSPGGGAAARVTVRVERGAPVGLNGVALSPAEIVDSVATIARQHGVAPTVVGAAGRRWHVDAPAVEVLSRTCAAMAARTLDERALEVAEGLGRDYATLVRDGLWKSPLREALDAFMVQLTSAATGDVTVTLADGRIEVQE